MAFRQDFSKSKPKTKSGCSKPGEPSQKKCHSKSKKTRPGKNPAKTWHNPPKLRKKKYHSKSKRQNPANPGKTPQNPQPKRLQEGGPRRPQKKTRMPTKKGSGSPQKGRSPPPPPPPEKIEDPKRLQKASNPVSYSFKKNQNPPKPAETPPSPPKLRTQTLYNFYKPETLKPKP